MRRILVVVALIGAMLAFPACSSTAYSGNVSGAVEYAQSLKTSDKVTIEVTGYVNGNYGTCVFIRNGVSDRPAVMAFFDEEKNFEGMDRLTVKGELKGNYVEADNISLFHCQIVK